jgi:hypothetical protein
MLRRNSHRGMGAKPVLPYVFISYRRDDSLAFAGRLADFIRTKYGPQSVFLDTENVASGSNWSKRIHSGLEACSGLIVVISPKWQARLSDEDDWPRMEIRAAIDANKPILPIVSDMSLVPSRDELPSDICALADQQALEVRPDRFHHDCAQMRPWLDSRLCKLVARDQFLSFTLSHGIRSQFGVIAAIVMIASILLALVLIFIFGRSVTDPTEPRWEELIRQ